MNADIITDATHPHGTSEGFRAGCTTTHCPSEVSCAVVFTRTVGDWAFKKQLDAGMTPIEIITLERKQAQEAADADLRAKRARPGPRTGASAGDRRAAANRARADGLALIPRHVLREHLNQGLTDRQIADLYGLERRQVAGTRTNAGWERNPDRNRRPTPAPVKPAGASSLEAT